MQLHEKYRPHILAEVIGQDKAVATITRLQERGLGGRALIQSIESGAML